MLRRGLLVLFVAAVASAVYYLALPTAQQTGDSENRSQLADSRVPDSEAATQLERDANSSDAAPGGLRNDAGVEPSAASSDAGVALSAMADEEWAQLRIPALDGLPILSRKWIENYWIVCQGRDRYFNCPDVKNLAIHIATEPRGEDDSWPHRLEFEIKEYLEEVEALHGIDGHEMRCNRAGCLVYLVGRARRMFGSGGDPGAFLKSVHQQAWIAEFEKLVDGRTGVATNSPVIHLPLRPRYAKTRRDKGLLMIMERAKVPPDGEEQ